MYPERSIAEEYGFIVRKYGGDSHQARLASAAMASNVDDEEVLLNLRKIYLTGEVDFLRPPPAA